ncbi:MAG: response regulator [Thermodesulfovibrionales bacterium]
MKPEREVNILLVEDDPGDVELVREALMESKLIVTLDVVGNGEEAMQYLRRQPPFPEAKRPDLILLDLNMPKKSGREVLKELKEDEGLRSLPVCILTTSQAEADIAKSYYLGANCYITKPMGLEEFAHVVKSIEDFWFAIVTLPQKEER